MCSAIVIENQAILALLSLNWSSFFIVHIFPQIHRASKCTYPYAERATVPYRRRYVGKRGRRYCDRHISQVLAAAVRQIAIWCRYIKLSDWLCNQAK